MTIHAPGDSNSHGAPAKGLRLPPSEVFEVGDLVCELYADRKSDLGWSGHVSVIRPGSRERLDRFSIEGSHATLGLLLAAAHAAVEARSTSEPSGLAR